MTHAVRSGSHMAHFGGTVMQRFVSASEGGVPNPHQGYLVLASRQAKGLGRAMRDCSDMIDDLRRGALAATSHLSDADLERLRSGIMWHERETLVLEMGRAASAA